MLDDRTSAQQIFVIRGKLGGQVIELARLDGRLDRRRNRSRVLPRLTHAAFSVLCPRHAVVELVDGERLAAALGRQTRGDLRGKLRGEVVRLTSCHPLTEHRQRRANRALQWSTSSSPVVFRTAEKNSSSFISLPHSSRYAFVCLGPLGYPTLAMS